MIENSLDTRASIGLDVVLNGCHSKREMLGMFTYRKLNALYVNPGPTQFFKIKIKVTITDVGSHANITS